MSDFFTLKMTKEQAEVVSKALEFLARISLGQLWEVCNDHRYGFGWNLESIQEAKKFAERIGELLTGLPTGCFYGIYGDGVTKTAKSAYEIYQVVRNCLAWDANPEGGITVDFDAPMKILNDFVPLPMMEKSNGQG
jgi:hypothetical protein